MSKFYGTLSNEKGSTTTREGRESISASAQSYEGSVVVELSVVNGEIMVDIGVAGDSSHYSDRTLLTAPLSKLIDGHLVLTE